MTKYVGVGNAMLLMDEAAVKRAALLFEGICLAGTTILRFLETCFPEENGHNLRTLLAKNDWLLERGVLVAAPPEFGSEALAEVFLTAILSSSKSAVQLREQIRAGLRGPDGDRIGEGALSGIARRAARRLEADTGWDTVVFGSRTDQAPIFEPGDDAVAQVVLKSVPLPNDGTPWEDILDYRNDPDSRIRFLRLKHWMNAAVTQSRSPRDLHDELQTLLAEYEDHMKLHRMKVRTGAIETFVTTTAEVLEGLVKVKWSDSARALFSFRRRRLQLLEAERQAPGRQLAYLAHIRGRFR